MNSPIVWIPDHLSAPSLAEFGKRQCIIADPSADFDHPNIPEGSPLRRHVVYRMARENWRP